MFYVLNLKYETTPKPWTYQNQSITHIYTHQIFSPSYSQSKTSISHAVSP